MKQFFRGHLFDNLRSTHGKIPVLGRIRVVRPIHHCWMGLTTRPSSCFVLLSWTARFELNITASILWQLHFGDFGRHGDGILHGRGLRGLEGSCSSSSSTVGRAENWKQPCRQQQKKESSEIKVYPRGKINVDGEAKDNHGPCFRLIL